VFFLFNFLRKLFWTDVGTQPVVECASLEGRDRAVVASTNLVSPTGLTIDFTEDRLFWCDQKRGLVETAALDGSDRRVLLENQVGEVCVKHTHANIKRCTELLSYCFVYYCSLLRKKTPNSLRMINAMIKFLSKSSYLCLFSVIIHCQNR